MAKLPHSPLFYEYLRKYQEDPTSRIFAPLAEAYRKAGMVEQAIEIAREGLAVHPTFIGGKVALARALFDAKAYDEVVRTLAPVVLDVPDNLVAQKVMAESCLMVGRVTEALSAYKMLLYFNPEDAETAKLVQELEAQAYERGTLVLRTDPPARARATAPDAKAQEDELPSFDERPLAQAFDEDPDALAARRGDWIERVERLQGMLQKIERYRRQNASA